MTFARLQHIEERSSSPLANVQSVPLYRLIRERGKLAKGAADPWLLQEAADVYFLIQSRIASRTDFNGKPRSLPVRGARSLCTALVGQKHTNACFHLPPSVDGRQKDPGFHELLHVRLLLLIQASSLDDLHESFWVHTDCH